MPSRLIHVNGDINGLTLNEFQDYGFRFISIQPNPSQDICIQIHSMGGRKLVLLLQMNLALKYMIVFITCLLEKMKFNRIAHK
ncbi:MAG: hypothetical protein IPJ43_01515 [Saprospiraceae bacterium]|nr:hypothetical protein [Saprospiraceae bacterium]